MSYPLSSSHYTSPDKRSVSPIHHIKSPVYYVQTTPPQNITVKKVAPAPAASAAVRGQESVSPARGIDADLWKSRVNELEVSLCHANTELEVANFKAKKTKDLETRVELILKQNAQLLGENDQLQKNFNQKKTEAEIWKGKYESQMNTIISMKANYELDIKKLQAENAKSKASLDQLAVEKHREAEELKGKLFVDSSEKVELLKRTHAKNASLYEEQLRKLKETIDEREREIAQLTHKLASTRNDDEQEMLRLNDDREKLRQRILALEIDAQKQLELQRIKIDQQFAEQAQAMKQLHREEVSTLESEIRKLKNLIDAKNDEIQILIQQNRNQKANFDNEALELRAEINAYKEKISDINFVHQNEFEDLKSKLATLHTQDAASLRERFDAMEHALQEEIQRLNNLILAKSEDLDNQIKEKHEQRDAYYKETNRLKDEIENLRYKYAMLEKEREKQLADAAAHLEKANQTHEAYSEQLKQQIQFLEAEIDELKAQIVRKNNELDENLAKSRAQRSTLEEDLRFSITQQEDWHAKFEQLDAEKEKITKELKDRISLQETAFLDKLRRLEQQLDFLEGELRRTKEALALRSEECNNHIAHRNQQELEIRKLKAEIDALGDQIIRLERIKAKELEDQRVKFEQSNQFAELTLKQSHANQVAVLNGEINTLKAHIDVKNREVEDMIEKYERLESAFNEFNRNADRLEDYEKKVQLLGAEIATTKNLYDVFVRTKSRFVRK